MLFPCSCEVGSRFLKGHLRKKLDVSFCGCFFNQLVEGFVEPDGFADDGGGDVDTVLFKRYRLDVFESRREHCHKVCVSQR